MAAVLLARPAGGRAKAAYPRSIASAFRHRIRSEDDLATTAGMMRAANVIGIPILDHIIVAQDPRCHHSMHEYGTLPRV